MTELIWSSLYDIKKIKNLKLKNKKIDNNIVEKKIIKKMDDILFNKLNKYDISKKNSLDILNYELKISEYINKKYFSIGNFDKKDFLILINNILICTIILKERLKQKDILINYELITENYLPRNSYKFCNHKDSCKFNYSSNKNNGCFADHYVHSTVEVDLKLLIYFIENKIENNFNNHKIILKSLSTINFVIKHMYEELNSINIYSNKKNIEKYHTVNKRLKVNNRLRKVKI